MSRWLTKASNALSRREQPVPEPFEIRCSNGHSVRGLRQVEHQEVRCSRCGEWLFVLPVDVYPRPKSKGKESKRRVAKSAAQPKSKSSRALAADEQMRPAIRTRFKERARSLAKTGVERLRHPLGRRRLFTRFRLVLLSIVTIVAATGYFVYQSGVKEEAELTLQNALEQGERALRNRDFEAAAHELRLACDALDVLGRDDAEARRVRQASREATAASRLCRKTLFEIVSEAQAESATDPKSWETKFDALYENAWIVMETTATAADKQTGRSVQIEYPLAVGDRPVVLDADVPVIERLSLGKQPRHVVFAAQLEACSFVETPEPHWLITLRKETAFLWTGYDTFVALGFTPDEIHTEAGTRQLFEEQSQVMESVP